MVCLFKRKYKVIKNPTKKNSKSSNYTFISLRKRQVVRRNISLRPSVQEWKERMSTNSSATPRQKDRKILKCVSLSLCANQRKESKFVVRYTFINQIKRWVKTPGFFYAMLEGKNEHQHRVTPKRNGRMFHLLCIKDERLLMPLSHYTFINLRKPSGSQILHNS